MKTIHWLLLGILCLFVTSCGSDEPDAPYTGPWEIYYGESYWGIHNDSKEFNAWLADHKNCMVECVLYHLNGNSVQYTDYITEDDYKDFYYGNIAWVETIDEASESEIEKIVNDFTSFTIEDKKNSCYDRFYAIYQRCDGK